MMPSILIIDDEATIRKSLRHIFQAKGYQVLEAGNGEAGFSLAQAEGPEVILLDLNLPDCHGLELMDRLKAANPEAAVIVLTGHGSVEAAVVAVRKGAEDFLEKDPRSLEATEVKVEKAVELLRLRRENFYYRSRAPFQAFVLGAFCPYCVVIDSSTILTGILFLWRKGSRVFTPQAAPV